MDIRFQTYIITKTESAMQKWEYLRLTVNYRGQNEVYYAVSNGEAIFSKEEQTTSAHLQVYIETLGTNCWELVNVYQDSQLCEIYHFKRPLD